MTIRRISFLFIAFQILVAMMIGLGVYGLGDTVLDDELDKRLTAENAYLLVAYERGGAELLKTVIRERDDRGVNSLGYLLADAQGRVVGGELRTAPPPLGFNDIAFTDSDGRDHVARALTRPLSDGSHLTVAVESTPAQKLQASSLMLLLGGLVVMLLGGVLIIVLFSRIIRARLAAMNQTALAIIAGDTDQRVPERGRDPDFGQLAITMNRMLDRNSALIASLRQVSSDIAHDLRTPIARLKRRLQNARDHAATGRDPLPEIDAGLEQSDKILSLFSALLRIAEVESGALRKYFTPFDLSDAVRMTCEIYGAVAEDADRNLTYDVAPDIEITGDRELVCQALINLLENGLRHTPPGTTIAVTLRLEPRGAALNVADDGPGVAEILLPTLTNRFTRSSRNRGTPGYGLGLHGVRAIAAAHDAALSLRNRQTGLEVTLTFPTI